jgi:hypothetical protein
LKKGLREKKRSSKGLVSISMEQHILNFINVDQSDDYLATNDLIYNEPNPEELVSTFINETI